MRSAILQPDVPAQLFPARKAMESGKIQPGETGSKRAPSRPKSGAKRKASETGFDEFDDAGIDDADLALVENGGFENIDDFDDEGRPSAIEARKKQKTSNVHDSGPTKQEPRQLENGKWACNHNCKDKSACKHLCCREGLDKKPKPSKAKTSKKEAEPATDPKQTQLSMSVSKRVDAPAATRPPTTERSAPATKRNPPKGPEMHNLATLHNNVKSNMQSVPLLSATSSRTIGRSSPVVLPRPGQSRSKASEAARRAAQSVYSDNFGDIDDPSLFDGLPDVGPPARPSPLPLTESDLFNTDMGDMLDNLSPVNKDDAHSRGLPATAQDDQTQHFSVYDFDDDTMFSAGQNLNDAGHLDLPNVRQDIRKSAAPFLEVSDDSAAFDLGCRGKDQVSTSTVAANSPFSNGFGRAEDHGVIQSNATNAEVIEERPISPDSATKVFMEEFGTDLFNYTG